jgi:transcriptional regulatory protein LEU3
MDSKLELLEQELRSIKEAVQPKSNANSTPIPQTNNVAFSIQSNHTPSTTNGAVFTTSSNLQSPQQPQPFVPSATLLEKTEATKPRIINGQLVSGQDIEWYFEK